MRPSDRRLPQSGTVPGVGMWTAGVLFAMTLLVYLPAMTAGFIWDDDQYVTKNVPIQTTDGLRRIWFEPTATPQYYPLVFSTFWVEYRLWGLDPFGYHVVNIVLHALNAVLLLRALSVLRVPGAFFAAALFAVAPMHFESVAWVTERKNVLSGLFYLSAFLSYWRFCRIGVSCHWSTMELRQTLRASGGIMFPRWCCSCVLC